MRFLHTSDWHLGRTIRGHSRIDESARALDDVVRIARDEGVDAVLIAGDNFDAFGPPTDAQKLLFETLSRFVSEGRKVVMIAGNHDSAPRMDAFARILEFTGVHCIGSPIRDDSYAPVTITSRSGEAASIVAVPWINERFVLDYEKIAGSAQEVHEQYAQRMEAAVRYYASRFDAKAIRVFMGHMFVHNAKPGGGERQLQMGDLFAVLGQSLPATAQYVALGHVHRDQEVPGSPVAGASFYSGSLLQLDFGEAEQKKYVRIVDIAGPDVPADVKRVEVSGGVTLRDIHTNLDDLRSWEGKHPHDYLRVFVEVSGPAPSLQQQVRDALPNAVDVITVRTNQPDAQSDAPHRGLEPHELLTRYYSETHNAEIPKELLNLFVRMHEEALHATA